MQIVLTALRCEKGEPDTNLQAHRSVLATAAARDADLVVFPEMSLSGSVDVQSHPERLLARDAPAVRALVGSTHGARAAVVFGIAEAGADGQAYITQLVARDGEVIAAHRKRHLGDGEEGFATGNAPTVFEHGGTPVGLLICAESNVDWPFDECCDAGAALVCFCAAPGLDERCHTDHDWSVAHAWWESVGLEEAQRHARRRGVWVACSGQAGATCDEDFPGLAALVGPSGALVARLPDWREGTLAISLPPAPSGRSPAA